DAKRVGFSDCLGLDPLVVGVDGKVSGFFDKADGDTGVPADVLLGEASLYDFLGQDVDEAGAIKFDERFANPFGIKLVGSEELVRQVSPPLGSFTGRHSWLKPVDGRILEVETKVCNAKSSDFDDFAVLVPAIVH